ncbi:TOM (translocase of outer membrane) complex component [Thoreauomyces humboldtii]|nr:TOM (translocase of outer membrane) complex component [Thoreauomyces humboldtii]
MSSPSVSGGSVAATADAAAKRLSSPQVWKTLLAVTLAAAVVGTGAYYALRSRPSQKKGGASSKRPASDAAARKAKSTKASAKASVKATAAAGTDKSSAPSSLRDSKAPSTDGLADISAGSSSASLVPELAGEANAHLFPADIEALAPRERADLAASAKTAGNKFFAQKKYEEAITLYSQAIALKPEDAVFYSNRAACYSNLSQWDDVINDCTESLRLDPSYVKALNRRGQAYERSERYGEALNDYTVMCVLEEFKNDTALAATDRVLKIIASTKAAEAMKTRVARLPSDTFIAAFMDSFRLTTTGAHVVVAHPATEAGDKLVQEAFQAIIEKRWGDAQVAASASVDNGELSAYFEPLAFNLRATFAFLKGDVEFAFADLEKSLASDPKNVNSIIKRASIFMERADIERAVAEYDRAVQIDDRDPDVYYHRGQIRVLTQDFYGAIEDYKLSIGIDPNFVYAHIQLGVAQYKVGEVQTAIDTFKKATRKFAKSGEVFNYHGEILLDTQQFDEAIKNFDKAIEIMPTSPLPYINKAILYLQGRNDPIAAEVECRKAIEVDPLCDIAYAQLAQLLLAQGKFEESLETYDHAANLARTEPELANAIALREAAAAQLYVAQRYPEVIARLRGGM